jgi:hypothetical protein
MHRGAPGETHAEKHTVGSACTGAYQGTVHAQQRTIEMHAQEHTEREDMHGRAPKPSTKVICAKTCSSSSATSRGCTRIARSASTSVSLQPSIHCIVSTRSPDSCAPQHKDTGPNQGHGLVSGK